MVVTQKLDSGTVLVNTESGDCFELNQIGHEIWESIRRGLSPTEITRKLIERYPDDGTHIASDVESLIDDLVRQRILTVSRT
jgi:hypothetical protein